jgi:DNA invertase Pin-like site-specific DNA recombinase
MSIEAQIDRAIQYKHYKIKDVQWSTDCYPEGTPGFFVDRGVSAYGNSKLAKRPAGSRLLEKLQKGDHLLVWSVDRMFRNLGDFGTVMGQFAKRGIIVHFIHEGIDLSTASGQLKAAICAVLAEHWSRMISFRTREANAIKAARQGKAIPPKPKAPVNMNVDEVVEFREHDQIASLVAATPSRKKKRKEAQQVTRTWGYIRVSSTGQVESGLGLQYQRERVEEDLKAIGGECLGIVADEAVSSFKVPFAERPGGKRILGEAKRGDCVVVYRFDRIFRSLQDMVNTLKEFHRRGIILRLIEEGIRTDQNDGDWYLGLLGTFAELESTMKGERISEAKMKMKREGLKYTKHLMCYKSMCVEGQNRFVLSGSNMVRFRMSHILWKEMKFSKNDCAHIVNALFSQNRRKQWANHVFEDRREKRKGLLVPNQIGVTYYAWPKMIESIGLVAINRFDKIARKELATDISELTLLRLKRAGVSLDRLRDWFVIMGTDRRIPAALHLREGDDLLASMENL